MLKPFFVALFNLGSLSVPLSWQERRCLWRCHMDPSPCGCLAVAQTSLRTAAFPSHGPSTSMGCYAKPMHPASSSRMITSPGTVRLSQSSCQWCEAVLRHHPPMHEDLVHTVWLGCRRPVEIHPVVWSYGFEIIGRVGSGHTFRRHQKA